MNDEQSISADEAFGPSDTTDSIGQWISADDLFGPSDTSQFGDPYEGIATSPQTGTSPDYLLSTEIITLGVLFILLGVFVVVARVIASKRVPVLEGSQARNAASPTDREAKLTEKYTTRNSSGWKKGRLIVIVVALLITGCSTIYPQWNLICNHYNEAGERLERLTTYNRTRGLLYDPPRIELHYEKQLPYGGSKEICDALSVDWNTLALAYLLSGLLLVGYFGIEKAIKTPV